MTYVSLHRHPNYPGTGTVSKGNCLNFPLPRDCGDTFYLKTLDKALGSIDISKFEVVGVSAGFDTHDGDLASLGLTAMGYKGIGKKIAGLGKPTFFLLEGGYAGENVGKDINALLTSFERKTS